MNHYPMPRLAFFCIVVLVLSVHDLVNAAFPISLQGGSTPDNRDMIIDGIVLPMWDVKLHTAEMLPSTFHMYLWTIGTASEQISVGCHQTAFVSCTSSVSPPFASNSSTAVVTLQTQCLGNAVYSVNFEILTASGNISLAFELLCNGVCIERMESHLLTLLQRATQCLISEAVDKPPMSCLRVLRCPAGCRTIPWLCWAAQRSKQLSRCA